ncbi:hypothetical protein JXD20_04175 [Candidatus Peregrinibacteria bacterium]|nr:hypothetical protein [Candidatus Peregrinibacteria bacterium]
MIKKITAVFIIVLLSAPAVIAQTTPASTPAPVTTPSSSGSSSATEPTSVTGASFQSRCAKATEMGFPPCATAASECGSDASKENRTPFNCLFLQEPLGGERGFDLYKATPLEGGGVAYTLWYGEAIVGKDQGPFQAILVFEEGRETQGPFGLLYNYLALVYNFVSGVIIGFVVLVVIIGGIRIATAGAEADQLTKGKDMIKKALIGMILWFTASVILYTINPTFFAYL